MTAKIHKCRVCGEPLRVYRGDSRTLRIGRHYCVEHGKEDSRYHRGNCAMHCSVCDVPLPSWADTAKHWMEMTDEELAHHIAVVRLCYAKT